MAESLSLNKSFNNDTVNPILLWEKRIPWNTKLFGLFSRIM